MKKVEIDDFGCLVVRIGKKKKARSSPLQMDEKAETNYVKICKIFFTRYRMAEGGSSLLPMGEKG